MAIHAKHFLAGDHPGAGHDRAIAFICSAFKPDKILKKLLQNRLFHALRHLFSGGFHRVEIDFQRANRADEHHVGLGGHLATGLAFGIQWHLSSDV